MPAMQIARGAIQAFRGARDAVIVSEELMKRFGWKVGDRIPLTSVVWENKNGGRSWDYTIVGAYSAPSSLVLRNSLQTNYDYLDQSRTKNVGMTNGFLVRVTDPMKAGAIAATLDALTHNSPYETKTEVRGAVRARQRAGDRRRGFPGQQHRRRGVLHLADLRGRGDVGSGPRADPRHRRAQGARV